MTARQPLLGMDGVRKRFPTPHGDVEVLRGVDLCIGEGEFVVMTGPSGSGKSTCLHLAALLDRPSSGRVLFDGAEVSGLDETGLRVLRKHKVGVVFQNYCLLLHRSVAANVALRFRYLEPGRHSVAHRVAGALEALGLSAVADRPARLLSGGEMQRVSIARAIVHPPRLLIADEPTGNLDADAAVVVMDCFRRLNEAGMTILMVTHNEALLRFASRRVRMSSGKCTPH